MQSTEVVVAQGLHCCKHTHNHGSNALQTTKGDVLNNIYLGVKEYHSAANCTSHVLDVHRTAQTPLDLELRQAVYTIVCIKDHALDGAWPWRLSRVYAVLGMAAGWLVTDSTDLQDSCSKKSVHSTCFTPQLHPPHMHWSLVPQQHHSATHRTEHASLQQQVLHRTTAAW